MDFLQNCQQIDLTGFAIHFFQIEVYESVKNYSGKELDDDRAETEFEAEKLSDRDVDDCDGDVVVVQLHHDEQETSIDDETEGSISYEIYGTI